MKKPIEIRDLLSYKYLENLQYSPDGKVLAFQVAYADEEKNQYKRDIYLIEEGKLKPYTSDGISSLIFFEDEETMVIEKHKDNCDSTTTELYRLSIHGGEALPWLTLPFPMHDIKKMKDNFYYALGIIDMNDPDAYKDNEEVRKEKEKKKKEDADYQVVDEVPYWFNGAGFVNKNRTALFEIKVGNKVEVKRLTAKNMDVSEFIIEGDKVYFVGQTKERKINMYDKVFCYDTKKKKIETIYGKNDHRIGELFTLNKQLYCLATDMKEYGINETSNIMKLKKDSLVFVEDPKRQLYGALAGDTMLGGGKSRVNKENTLYTLATEEDHVALWKYNEKLEKTILFDEMGGLFFFDVGKDKIAYVYESETSLAEVYEMDLNGKHIQQLTNLNEEILKDKYVAVPKRIDFESCGEKLHGWVLLPENFNSKKKYPAILDIHGGPRTVYGTEFFHEMQVWAAKGYVVMYCNIRGSDGRDDAFADIRGQYGYVDFDNLMDFVDTVLEKYPNIDEKRVCETGGSYGGFMTNWIITHTNRFCCAASQRSISNWISMSFLSDIGLYFGPDQCGAEGLFGDKNIEKLWEHSPLKYAKNVKTPTLFIHSDEDYRCPLPEGMQMMQALAYQNIETRLVIFHGENHELSRSGKPKHRIRRLEEITNWFEIHAK